MSSIILRATARPLVAILAIISIFVLLRGHDAPGGGFIGGLLLTGGLALHLVAFGSRATARAVRLEPLSITAGGLLMVVIAAVVPLVQGDELLQAQWWFAIPHVAKVGTVLIFDIGVYLVVVGTALLILLTLAEE
ncbi:MAG: Na(+)/H(+) antiporter subunit B [Proteobacteria bacterium]|nr:Na(+)/H(+) antiporter subunit B [Pseudomonadota bacterium]